MKWKCRNSERALTKIDVVITVAVLAVLGAMLFSEFRKNRARVFRSDCIDNLRQNGLAFRKFQGNSSAFFPMMLPTVLGGSSECIQTGEVFRHFQAISNELASPKLLVCPADKARRPEKDFNSLLSNTNISYFVGVDADETRPSMFLAGDRQLTDGVPLPPSRIMALTSNSGVGWTSELRHSQGGNVLRAEGSVWSWSTFRLREGLANTGVATNRLAIP